MTRDEKTKVVVMPIFIVLLTALVGGLLTTYFQDRSFRKNAGFQARMNIIMSGRQEALKIREDVDEAVRQIRSNERQARQDLARFETEGNFTALQGARAYYCAPEYQGAFVAILRETRLRVESLREDTGNGTPISPINASINQFVTKLGPYIQCLEQSGCNRCSESNREVLAPLNSLVSAHMSAANRLVAGE
jgi:hypothetical protein